VIPPTECTESFNWGCDKTGSKDHPINPIRSARIDTKNSFSFKYGTLEIRAKMPAGDWLWPALWMMPKDSVYGSWPNSGEIDLMELRSNRQLYSGNTNVGVDQAESTIHFGPSTSVKNHYPLFHFSKNQKPGWNEDFNVYRLVWTPDLLQFLINGNIVGTVNPQSGFWNAGNFGSSGMQNPWEGGSKLAPFDKEFFIILNLAVGGTGYFVDEFENRNGGKPW
jgi:beta-glucanase (GH16 family)